MSRVPLAAVAGVLENSSRRSLNAFASVTPCRGWKQADVASAVALHDGVRARNGEADLPAADLRLARVHRCAVTDDRDAMRVARGWRVLTGGRGLPGQRQQPADRREDSGGPESSLHVPSFVFSGDLRRSPPANLLSSGDISGPPHYGVGPVIPASGAAMDCSSSASPTPGHLTWLTFFSVTGTKTRICPASPQSPGAKPVSAPGKLVAERNFSPPWRETVRAFARMT